MNILSLKHATLIEVMHTQWGSRTDSLDRKVSRKLKDECCTRMNR
jgi:hypothetical protein